MNGLLKSESTLSELFGSEHLDNGNCHYLKEENASEGDEGPLCSEGSVDVVVGGFWVLGVLKVPSFTVEFN